MIQSAMALMYDKLMHSLTVISCIGNSFHSYPWPGQMLDRCINSKDIRNRQTAQLDSMHDTSHNICSLDCWIDHHNQHQL